MQYNYIVPCPNMCRVLCVEHNRADSNKRPSHNSAEQTHAVSHKTSHSVEQTLEPTGSAAQAPLSSKPIIHVHHRCTEHVQNNYMRVKQWIKYVTHNAQ